MFLYEINHTLIYKAMFKALKANCFLAKVANLGNTVWPENEKGNHIIAHT